MSEYQYYEFVAVDQPLTPQQLEEVCSCSSRATITPRRFVNEYNWGNFRGDPEDWMRRYFDAHVYSANWGCCHLMLRLSAKAVDAAMIEACTAESVCDADSGLSDVFEVSVDDEVAVFQWSFRDDGGDLPRFGNQDDGPDWMARLLPLRDELLRGDSRPLYLGWLARVCAGELGDDDIEPPLPVGLAKLSPAQQSLVEFLEIDRDWLSAAAAASSAATVQSLGDHDQWLAEQTEASLRERVRFLLEGRGQEAERNARIAFLTWQLDHRPNESHAPRRRVAEIEAGVAAARERRLEAELVARAVAEARQRAERADELVRVAFAAKAYWREIDTTLQRGSGAGYNEALDLTKELFEALRSAGREAEFRTELKRLLETHGKRAAWVARLEKAGLLG